ncbi:MAG: hypothetical protein RIM99_05000 [Cyclobacteriaceae bacterium]
MNRLVIAALFSGSTLLCTAQSNNGIIEFAPLHLGITQGIGTNGIYDLKYENNFSFNLFSGQSWENNFLCISGISHFQLQESQGIYLSGIASVTGGYPFLKRRQLKDSLAIFNAIQISGLLNRVNGGGNGAQISTLLNTVSGSLDGAQISGLYNNAGKGFSGLQASLLVNRIGQVGIGVQTAFLINTSKNMSGGQFFGLFNTVKNDLDGVQIGGFNYIGNAKSPVYRGNKFYYLQLGLFNKAIQNGDGFQAGLVNSGKNIGFSQIGLINFSGKIPQYPIGLLNIAGDAEGFLRVSANRIFTYNIELGTGSKKVMNGLTYSWDQEEDRKAIGYALGDQIKGGYKKNEFFFDYYMTLVQVKEDGQSFLDPNFIYGTKVQFGYNPFMRTKIPWMFFFVGVSANIHNIENNSRLVSGILSDRKGSYERWLDVHVGVQL